MRFRSINNLPLVFSKCLVTEEELVGVIDFFIPFKTHLPFCSVVLLFSQVIATEYFTVTVLTILSLGFILTLCVVVDLIGGRRVEWASYL